MQYTYRKLTLENWDDFQQLFQKHKGVRGGCWCAYYLGRPKDFVFSEKERHREIHHEHVRTFGSTGIIMYEADLPIGYCQVAKFPIIERFDYAKGYERLPDEVKTQKDWRISCIFVDKDRRKRGLASKLFDFALEHIADSGGGMLEVFPFDHQSPPANSFTFNGSVAFYTKRGFERIAPIGTSSILMRKFIQPAR